VTLPANAIKAASVRAVSGIAEISRCEPDEYYNSGRRGGRSFAGGDWPPIAVTELAPPFVLRCSIFRHLRKGWTTRGLQRPIEARDLLANPRLTGWHEPCLIRM
jgi:hypothetical protein